MTDYKLVPIKKLLKKMVDESGTPESILNVAKELGLLTSEEYDILLKLKHGEDIGAANQETLDDLVRKKLILKK